jgi:uncharacterized lipoprotein YmbA
MNRVRHCVLGLLGGCSLLACGSSPPIRFYTLNAVAPSATGTAAAAGSIPVRVEPVAIPAELDRLELVNHTGPNLVHLADSDRWAAPLDEQIRRTLSDDLAARLPAGLLVDPNEPSNLDARRTLSISIGQFDADASCAVSLNASWTLRIPHAEDQSGSERIQQASSGGCPAALPAAMSRALGVLADRLAPMLAR